MIPCVWKIQPALNYDAFFGVWNQACVEDVVRKYFYSFA